MSTLHQNTSNLVRVLEETSTENSYARGLSEYVDRAIELQKKRAEIDGQLDAMKACLRLQYIKTGETKLRGATGTITVTKPKNCDPYVDDAFDVVVDTNNFSSTKLQKLVNKLVSIGKTSRRTMERCRSEGTRKISLSFPS